ncbi:MAG: LysR family transcriptional regulator [Coriobacteriales bacterium]|nr:LysR family transcriptional regulator [Coriobacteriales bacterium]
MCIPNQQFRVFKEVADTSNITLASKRLHMSQPSISIQIKNLEREIGAELFDRTNKGVTLTQAGWIFYQHVCQIMQIMQEAQEKIDELSVHQRGIINMGATLTIGEYILPLIIGNFCEAHSEIDFNAKIANTQVMVQEILEKRLHIALVEGPVPDDKDLVVENFWHDELAVVVPSGHPWAEQPVVDFDELANEKIILREKGSGTRRVMELALEDCGFDPDKLNVVMELGSTQAIKQAVMSHQGVTIISALTVRHESKFGLLKCLRIKECQLTRPLNVLTHARSHQSLEEQYFLSFMHDAEHLEPLLNASL